MQVFIYKSENNINNIVFLRTELNNSFQNKIKN